MTTSRSAEARTEEDLSFMQSRSGATIHFMSVLRAIPGNSLPPISRSSGRPVGLLSPMSLVVMASITCSIALDSGWSSKTQPFSRASRQAWRVGFLLSEHPVTSALAQIFRPPGASCGPIDARTSPSAVAATGRLLRFWSWSRTMRVLSTSLAMALYLIEFPDSWHLATTCSMASLRSFHFFTSAFPMRSRQSLSSSLARSFFAPLGAAAALSSALSPRTWRADWAALGSYPIFSNSASAADLSWSLAPREAFFANGGPSCL
mmetsp:Transcript_12860/g.37369  ORF Transcript_12860/g.37369 Transcript_12860/m.37369 type:complete len:262 (-) Transcript_12860:819-1604(-)